MSSIAHYDAVIIGAGVIGSAIAHTLALKGWRTLNLDSLPAAGYGSTSHSSAIIRPFYSHVTSAAIAHEARSRWQRWPEFLGVDDERGFASYRETGGLVLVRDGQEADYDANLAALESLNIEFERFTPDDLTRMFPEMCLDAFGPPVASGDDRFGQAVPGSITGAIYIPAAGYVSDPQLAAHNLANAAQANGAAFRFICPVTGILKNDDGITGVTTADGENIETPILVNAAGPHSAQVNRMAGAALPITTKAMRHEVAYARAPASYAGKGAFLVDTDCGVYQRPDGEDMLIGSVDPACDPPDEVNPDNYNTSLTDQWTTQVMRAGQRWPVLGIENTARGTVGLYDVSDDWIPVYDRTDIPGYFVAIGTSGNQFKNAPMVGDIMYQVINAADHDNDPAHLTLRDTGFDADLSFYSRRRDIQQTASVLA